MMDRYHLTQFRNARHHLVDGLLYALTAGPLPPRSRFRYLMTLWEVDALLRSLEIPAGLRNPVCELYTALLDLESGIVAEFLKPAPTFNRTQESSLTWQARSYLAIAVDVLVASGLSRSAAAKEVARHSRAIHELCTKNAKSASSALATWHAQLVRGKIKCKLAVTAFAERETTLEQTYSQIGSRDPHRAARDLVHFVERLWSREKAGA
jgi:hypothetical protein